MFTLFQRGLKMKPPFLTVVVHFNLVVILIFFSVIFKLVCALPHLLVIAAMAVNKIALIIILLA